MGQTTMNEHDEVNMLREEVRRLKLSHIERDKRERDEIRKDIETLSSQMKSGFDEIKNCFGEKYRDHESRIRTIEWVWAKLVGISIGVSAAVSWIGNKIFVDHK